MSGGWETERPRSMVGTGRWWLRTTASIAIVGLLAPVAPILTLRFVPPPSTAYVFGNALERWNQDPPCRRLRYAWTPWEQISPWAGIAVVAAEDQLFPHHRGFDVDSIREAWDDRRNGRRSRGASTISQQVAKNLFLWSGRSWLRKGIEAYLTFWIELLWPKQRILEVYLNVAQFGPCTFGVTAASAEFFGKIPADLTLDEASRLATVLPNPVRMRVERPGPWARSQAARIRRQVRQLGGPAYLSSEAPPRNTRR